MAAVYFLGIGGIGMSALARYFLSRGYAVGGYDLRRSPLTQALEEEGAEIHYTDSVALIPECYLQADTLVVYTPAIPENHSELNYYKARGQRLMKRAEVLGEITRLERGLCVAGTHGKTTTSTLLAHLLRQSPVDCKAFLGGIASNYQTNLLLSEHSPYVVVEADEFDRSFHHLTPHIAIITSADPDHLDIYGTEQAYRESFEYFTSLISPGGALLLHEDVDINPRLAPDVRLYRYASRGVADFWASNIRVEEARLFFDWHYPALGVEPAGCLSVELGVPLRINVDNAVAAMAVAYLSGVALEGLGSALASFRGVQRRFERVVDTPEYILIDDYAHHPVELEASIRSVRQLYPERRLLGIFQPHLYSRTQDFYAEFAQSLAGLDDVILLDIYPAREEPIPGVSSRLIAEAMPHSSVPCLSKEGLIPFLEQKPDLPSLVLMLGAGDIDSLVPKVAELLQVRTLKGEEAS